MSEEMNSLMSDDNSFVILGQSSMRSDMDPLADHSLNSQLSHHSMGKSVNGILSVGQHSWGSEASSNEIKLKLDQLVKENQLLKDSLNQSNLAMKSQYDTLVSWHQEVLKTYESHKLKFTETQDQIKKLQSQNAILKHQLQLGAECANGNEQNKFNPGDLASDKSVNRLQGELDYYENKCKELEKANEQLNICNSEIQKKLQCLGTENMDLQKRLDEVLQRRMSSLDRTSITKNTVTDDTEDSILNPEYAIIDKINQAVSDFKLSESKHAMEIEISRLKKKILEQQETILGKSDEINNIKKEHQKMIEEQHNCYKEAVKQYEERIQGLNLKIKETECTFEKANKELQENLKEMEKTKQYCDEVNILRHQAEVYKSDFEEERREREKAVGEKEEVLKTVRLLERKIEELKKQQRENQEESSPSSASSQNQTEEPTVADKFPCIGCHKNFRKEEIEDHVIECLHLTD